MPNHEGGLSSGNKRITSASRVQDASWSFRRPDPEVDVDVAAVKSVMYSQHKTSDAMNVVYPCSDRNKLAIARGEKVESSPKAYNLRGQQIGKSGAGFNFSITVGTPDDSSGRVSAEEIAVIRFPDAIFRHEVVIYRPSRTIEICETPFRLTKKKPNITFRRWAIVLNDQDMRRTKRFMEYLERQFRVMHPDVLSYVNTPRDLRDQTIRRNAPNPAAPKSSRLHNVRLPENAVVYNFPKSFARLCYTGFIASPEMQKLLKGISGGLVDENANEDGNEQTSPRRRTAVDQGRAKQTSAQKRKAKINEAQKKAADRRAVLEQERVESKANRQGKKNVRRRAKRQAKKAAVDPDAEWTPASGI